MKRNGVVCLIVSLGFVLSGCENMNNQDVGTLSGAAIGGLVGSRFGGGMGQVVATGAGAVAGAYIGASIGQRMDHQDQAQLSTTLESNPVGKPHYWVNRETHTKYVVTPHKDVTVQGNQYCREYDTVAVIAGKKQSVYGTACRQPDGSWKVIN